MGYKLENIDVSSLKINQILEIRDLVLKHKMIVIPNQQLSPNDLEKFTQYFGEIIKLPSYLSHCEFEPDCEYVMRISNILNNKQILKNHYNTAAWHTDGDFWPAPRNYIWNFLYGKIITKNGGGTLFADCERAYLTLKEEQKRALIGKKILVNSSHIPFMQSPDCKKKPERMPRAIHEILATHPVTQKKHLYVSGPENAIRIFDEDKETSAKTMAWLHQHILQEDNLYLHHWNKCDLIIWDNLMSLHTCYGDYQNEPRLLYKTEVWPVIGH